VAQRTLEITVKIVIIIVWIDQDRGRDIRNLLLIADFIEQQKPKKKEENNPLNEEKH
jgi:hypothetical protein